VFYNLFRTHSDELHPPGQVAVSSQGTLCRMALPRAWLLMLLGTPLCSVSLAFSRRATLRSSCSLSAAAASAARAAVAQRDCRADASNGHIRSQHIQ
jgi:hypothetical protein